MNNLENNDYKSDYDIMLEQGNYIKTDGYGEQHNVLVYKGDKSEGEHEHAGYDYKSGKTFWHGMYYETKHNKVFVDENRDKMIETYDKGVVDKENNGLSNAEIMDFIGQCNDKEKLKELRNLLFGEEEDEVPESEQKVLKRNGF